MLLGDSEVPIPEMDFDGWRVLASAVLEAAAPLLDEAHRAQRFEMHRRESEEQFHPTARWADLGVGVESLDYFRRPGCDCTVAGPADIKINSGGAHGAGIVRGELDADASETERLGQFRRNLLGMDARGPCGGVIGFGFSARSVRNLG